MEEESQQLDNDYNSEQPCEFFPNVLLLSISNAPWEEYPHWR